MSSSGKAGSGRGNNRKRSFRRRGNETWTDGDFRGKNAGGEPRSSRAQTPVKGTSSSPKKSAENPRGDRVSYYERPKWIPPKVNTEPLPVSDCPWCGKPIRDMFSAIADKDTGYPVHFDCVTARIAFAERLEKGDIVAYIGGGRFAIVSFDSTGSSSSGDKQGVLPAELHGGPDNMQLRASLTAVTAGRSFVIKKIIEWENKDKRAEWRSAICDHYSVT